MDTLFIENFYKQCELLHKSLLSNSSQVLTNKQIEEALSNTLKEVSVARSGGLSEITTRDPSVLLEFVREAYSAWVDNYNLTNSK